MQQVHEITRVALKLYRQVLESASILLRCGTCLAIMTGMVACTGKGQNNGGDAGGPDDKSIMSRILRRGLPGEPRTLDPQLGEDNFSFPVLRDLYEGLTAEDRKGHVVPGAAESWTVDQTGTVYTFLIRPDAKWSNGDRTLATEFVRGFGVPLIHRQLQDHLHCWRS